MIDLRSDTVTRPTAGMRAAIAAAEVGDDVFGDDPTVKELERGTALLLDKEAAVFMPSGTMANQVALRSHTEPGDEVVVEARAHLYYYEAGAPAALSGVSCRLVTGDRGVFGARELRAVLRPPDVHFPRTRLVCVENTHNAGGGKVWPIEKIVEVTDLAREAGLRTHLDGARLWNASAASGLPEAEYARRFDSVSVCFSKGLGAPVGSALAGPASFCDRARRFRKQFGGGMRQAGVVAAGALYALSHNRERLREDHENARALAEGLATIPGVRLDPRDVETNIVFFDVPGLDATALCAALRSAGVHLLAVGPATVRAVTSLEVSRQDVDRTVEIVRGAL